VMDGVINGFEENVHPLGLKELMQRPSILGVFSWSRGGGWYGPYITNELWPDLNAYVLAQFVKNPAREEEQIFRQYAVERLGLQRRDVPLFRELCLCSARAVLRGRYCAVFDRSLKESVLPTGLWMRDDRLGGRQQLAEVLDYLGRQHAYGEALAEKAEAVRLWDRVSELAHEIGWPDSATGEFARVSAEYGRRLFHMVEQAWRVLVADHQFTNGMPGSEAVLEQALAGYDAAWEEYHSLSCRPQCPTLYLGKYFNLPGQPEVAGLEQSIAECRRRVQVLAVK